MVSGVVAIPAGETGVDFSLTAIDNSMVDGYRSLTVTASAADFENASAVVGVVDNDIGALTLTVDETSIDESGDGTTATLSRNGILVNPLVVDLSSSDTTEATVPATVTIPTGQVSVGFTVTAVDDSDFDSDQMLTLTASITGYGYEMVGEQ